MRVTTRKIIERIRISYDLTQKDKDKALDYCYARGFRTTRIGPRISRGKGKYLNKGLIIAERERLDD